MFFRPVIKSMAPFWDFRPYFEPFNYFCTSNGSWDFWLWKVNCGSVLISIVFKSCYSFGVCRHLSLYSNMWVVNSQLSCRFYLYRFMGAPSLLCVWLLLNYLVISVKLTPSNPVSSSHHEISTLVYSRHLFMAVLEITPLIPIMSPFWIFRSSVEASKLTIVEKTF